MIPGLLLGSSALNIGGSIFGGLFGSGAEEDRAAALRAAGDEAAKGIMRATTNANRTARQYNETARGDLAPFREFGVNSGRTLTDLLFGGGDVSNFLKASPLFNFQSELGMRGINRELAARGLYGSGAGLETLARFNNQLVGEEGQRLVDRLFNLTNLGANSATNMASLTSQTGNSMADRLFTGGRDAATMRYNAATGAAQAESNAKQMLGQMGQSIFSGLGSGLMQYGNYTMMEPQITASTALMNAMAKKYGMTDGGGGSSLSDMVIHPSMLR